MATKKKKSSSKPKTPNTDYSQVLDKIVSVDEKEFNISMLLVGRSGTGKTTMACTFPKPILMLDFKDEGTDSVKDWGEDVKVLEVDHWDEVEQIYWYLKEGDHPYKTVIWDTITQAQDIVLKKVLEDSGKEWGALIHRQDWGAASGLMKTWFLNYRDLPMNFVITAQERVHDSDEEDEDQLDPVVGPRVMPSVAGTINPGVKAIGYTFIKEVTKRVDGKLHKEPQFCMRLGPHAYYITKVRRPKNKGTTPEYLVDPDYDKLVQVMKGEYQEEKPKKKKKSKKG